MSDTVLVPFVRAAVVLVTLVGGCLQPKPPQDLIAFTGNVIEASTQKGIAYARVRIDVRLATTRLTAFGLTDADGRYAVRMQLPLALSKSPALVGRLSVEANGFQPHSQALKVKNLKSFGRRFRVPTVRLIATKRSDRLPWEE